MKKVLKPAICAAMAITMATGYSCSKDDDGSKTSGEFEHEGSKYMVVKELKTWVEAAADAVKRGGRLVEIESMAEQEAVYKGIRDAGVSATYTAVADGGGTAYVWIGAMANSQRAWVWNGANVAGSYSVFWIDGVGAIAKSYANWGGTSTGETNEPDNFTNAEVAPKGQSVAAIGLANWPEGESSKSALGIAGEWNDIAIGNKLYYVVEFAAE
jgi:hypothetical protein